MSTPETDTDNGQTAKQRTAAQLESRAHAALRTAPALQAPSMLETRVYRELMRRAARPWWLRGFGSWPLGIQLLFLPLSAGFIKLAFLTAAGVSSAAGAASLSPLANTAQGHWQSLISAARTLQTVATWRPEPFHSIGSTARPASP